MKTFMITLMSFILLFSACLSFDIPMQETSAEAESACYPEEYLLFGLDMTVNDLSIQSERLIESAKTWTKDSVPQTLDEFPLMPVSGLEAYNSLTQSVSTLEEENGTYIWTTVAPELLADHEPDVFEAFMTYSVAGRSEYIAMQHQKGPDSFQFSLPEDVSIEDIEDISYYCHWYLPDGWIEILQVTYDMKNGKLTDTIFYGLLFTREDSCHLAWYPGGYSPESLAIDLCTVSGSDANRIWWLEYDKESGMLLSMSDNEHTIELVETEIDWE